MQSQLQNSKSTISFSCIKQASEIICAKWVALIIRELADEPKYFCELQENIIKINPRILSRRLEELLQSGIISKKVVSKSPLRTKYLLTSKGRDLIPILESMALWGEKHRI